MRRLGVPSSQLKGFRTLVGPALAKQTRGTMRLANYAYGPTHACRVGPSWRGQRRSKRSPVASTTESGVCALLLEQGSGPSWNNHQVSTAVGSGRDMIPSFVSAKAHVRAQARFDIHAAVWRRWTSGAKRSNTSPRFGRCWVSWKLDGRTV